MVIFNTQGNRKFTTFGYFIAGLIGCDVFDFSALFPFHIMCMYEAQDCSQLTNQSQHTFRISFNPMEMYAFGYVLVHVPIQCHLENYNELPFDILEDSLSSHASSIDQIQGSIVELTIYYDKKRDSSPPKYLLHSITKCTFQRFTASMLYKLLP